MAQLEKEAKGYKESQIEMRILMNAEIFGIMEKTYPQKKKDIEKMSLDYNKNSDDLFQVPKQDFINGLNEYGFKLLQASYIYGLIHGKITSEKTGPQALSEYFVKNRSRRCVFMKTYRIKQNEENKLFKGISERGSGVIISCTWDKNAKLFKYEILCSAHQLSVSSHLIYGVRISKHENGKDYKLLNNNMMNDNKSKKEEEANEGVSLLHTLGGNQLNKNDVVYDLGLTLLQCKKEIQQDDARLIPKIKFSNRYPKKGEELIVTSYHSLGVPEDTPSFDRAIVININESKHQCYLNISLRNGSSGSEVAFETGELAGIVSAETSTGHRIIVDLVTATTFNNIIFKSILELAPKSPIDLSLLKLQVLAYRTVTEIYGIPEKEEKEEKEEKKELQENDLSMLGATISRPHEYDGVFPGGDEDAIENQGITYL